MNGITQMRSRLSVNVTCGCDSARIGTASARADRVAGVPLQPAGVDIPGNQLNLAHSPRPDGQFGNVGRKILKNPAAYNWDFPRSRTFVCGKESRFGFAPRCSRLQYTGIRNSGSEYFRAEQLWQEFQHHIDRGGIRNESADSICTTVFILNLGRSWVALADLRS